MTMRVGRRLAGFTLGASAVAAAVALAGGPASVAGRKPATEAVPGNSAQVAALARAVVAGYQAPTRTLKPGMSGADVTAMQQRLVSLHYWLGSVTGSFNYDTEEAVYAFQAINGLSMSGVVGPNTAHALVYPRSHTPRDTRVATRIEVDINLNKQLLVYYKSNQIVLISHISSGKVDYATTPTGTYIANIFMAGAVVVPLGVMYNPIFFTVNGRTLVYAIHGDTAVPNYPDSHGCVRIPIDLSKVFYKMINIVDRNGTGTQIYIYGTNWRTGS